MSPPKSPRPHFLVIDHNADSRFLLVKTLLRKFPHSRIDETDDADVAVSLARKHALSAIVSHRTENMLGVELIATLRAVNAKVPIVMVSGIDRTEPAVRAGADRFLLYDEWLRIGTVVDELLAIPTPREPRVVEIDFGKHP